MKVKIIKSRKKYLIMYEDDNSVSNFETDKLEDLVLVSNYNTKSTILELSTSLFYTFKKTYPKAIKAKLLKLHKKYFNECFSNQNIENNIFKTIIKEEDDKIIVCYYFYINELKKFLEKNIFKGKIKILNENLIFNNKCKDILLINQYEATFWHQELLDYAIENTSCKGLMNSIKYFLLILYTKFNMNRLKIYIDYNIKEEYNNFINTLAENIEKKVVVDIETF